MHRWSKPLVLLLVVLFCVSPIFVLADDNHVLSPSGWPELSTGVSFEPIKAGTVDDLLVASRLIGITRNTFAPDYSVLGGFDDGISGGAMLLYVEEGLLEAVPKDAAGSSEPTLLVSTSEAVLSNGPQLVLPETRLSLDTGDLLAPPPGSDLFLMNRDGRSTVESLIVTFFPGQLSALLFGTTATQLEVNFGIETVRPLAPPFINIGRLIFEPASDILDHQAIWPRVVFVESGSVSITVSGMVWQVKRAGTESYDRVENQASESEVTLRSGDGAYIPLGATASLNNGGQVPATVLSFTVAPSAGEAGTPSDP